MVLIFRLYAAEQNVYQKRVFAKDLGRPTKKHHHCIRLVALALSENQTISFQYQYQGIWATILGYLIFVISLSPNRFHAKAILQLEVQCPGQVSLGRIPNPQLLP